MLRFFNVHFSDVVSMGLMGCVEFINFQSFFDTIHDWRNAIVDFSFSHIIKIKNLSIENTNGANDVCWVMTNTFCDKQVHDTDMDS